MTETNRIEYKAELTKDLDLEKEVVAFLNYHEGGLVYIGIDKTGKTLGVADSDADMLKIKDRIKNNISPSAMGLFDVVSEEKDGKTIIKIIVASGSEKPYFKKKYGMTEKGCFLRIGTAAEPMPQKMIEELFASRTRNSIGKIKANRQDVSFEQLRIYYEEKRKPLNKQFKRNLELLTPQGDLNYVGYLLADENNVSVKVAKYKDSTRVDLAESNEYGYVSLIKATKSVLDKIELENRTITQITSKERLEKRLWNSIALREAIINAFVHNDYTKEIAPKFEIFQDRIEITSVGSLPEGLSESEFFEGFSVPRNKELMRIFKDLDLVEQLGSGIPRILQSYGKECFLFSDNFLRMVFPSAEPVYSTEQVTEQDTEQVTEQVESLIQAMNSDEYSRAEIMELVGVKHRPTFLYNYLQPAIELGIIELTIPDKPNSSKQKYKLTQKGRDRKA
ncbi:Fic family protein [Flagellimonas sediminis]|uniref:Transcriptional regulator n=1 Tax=Flagellimonas sediminis TaxID=2696468 RepID=A0A6I5KYE9_9FLAO|nr:RNA-binding domain-containing protein [Allomuricauda sediminis]NDV44985.1 transcriptional regulator [Allomuricauda sediminis]